MLRKAMFYNFMRVVWIERNAQDKNYKGGGLLMCKIRVKNDSKLSTANHNTSRPRLTRQLQDRMATTKSLSRTPTDETDR